MTDDPQTRDEQIEGTAEALEQMIRSAGWKLFCDYARRTMSGPEAYGNAINVAVANINAGPDRPFEIQQAIDRIHFATDAVNTLMQWPKDEIARLTKHAKPRPFEMFRKVPR